MTWVLWVLRDRPDLKANPVLTEFKDVTELRANKVNLACSVCLAPRANAAPLAMTDLKDILEYLAPRANAVLQVPLELEA